MLALVQGAFTGLCAAIVAAFFVLVLTPRLHSPVRAHLRPAAIHHVERGLVWVAAAQRFERPWLTKLFTQSSHTVSVTFYASFLPILFWLGFPELGRNLVCLMSLALYVGNAIKDLVCSPRPLGVTYGKARLQFLGASDEEIELNAKEFGLPSSHTLNSLCLNYMCVWYLYDRQLIATGTAALLYCLVALWVVWIAASRVYLGLHTPVDILAGAIAGLAVLVVFIAAEGYLTLWLRSGPLAVLHAALASLVLLRLHPRPMTHTPSYEFSTSFMGAMFGVVVGVAWMSPGFHQPGVQVADIWGGSRTLAGSRLLWAARRLGIGFVAVVACKEVTRAVLLAVLPVLYRSFPLAVRRLWQPPMHNLYVPIDAPPGLDAPHELSNGHEASGARQLAANGKAPQEPAGERLRRRTTRSASPDRAKRSVSSSRRALPPAPVPGPAVPDPRLLAVLPHSPKGVPWDVDVTSRFFAYAGLGLAVAGVTPRILAALGW